MTAHRCSFARASGRDSGFSSIEAMACGAALVSTRNGRVDDFTVDGEAALLADVGDVGELTGAVLGLLADSGRRDEIAANGLRMADRFSWHASVEAFEGAARAALDQPVGTLT